MKEVIIAMMLSGCAIGTIEKAIDDTGIHFDLDFEIDKPGEAYEQSKEAALSPDIIKN